MDPFHPIQPIEPGLPGRIQRIDRDQQRERARDDQHSPSDDPDEQAFEEDFSEAYERSRREGEPGAGERSPAKPDGYVTDPPPEPASDWDPQLRRDRRTPDDDGHDPDEDDPGHHIDIIA